MDNQLFEILGKLINQEKFDEARNLIHERLKLISVESSQKFLFLKLKLNSFLVDIGYAGQNENDLLEAIEFYETNEVQLETCITKSTFYYNLANAKHGLGRVFYDKNRGVHPINVVKEKLQEPIKLYWLAYKAIGDKEENLLFKVLINLSNALVYTCRIVEALQLLDMVLRIKPDFPEALISRGDNLDYLSKVSNCSITTSLYVNIFQSYDRGIKTNVLPPSILNRSLEHSKQALNLIQEHGFSINDVQKEISDSEKEFNDHSIFRKYCITNFLTLNEHSIYCNCSATRKDDLQIGVRHGMFKGKIVPELELLLNRIKSEFALSRWLYFKSLQAESEVEFDILFSELLDGEIINSQSEMQRTSFRLCYGILDKIALGICKLYGLDNNRIHFETFWDEKKRKEQFNQIKNIHLNALYSIACDLNTTTGELKHFKKWRNDLEHNLLVLKDTSKPEFDVLKLFKDEDFVTIVDAEDFKNKTLHLMQLTRAAIFSFVFCVRLQTIHHRVEGNEKNSFMIDFKE
jgi:hypothetical protein